MNNHPSPSSKFPSLWQIAKKKKRKYSLIQQLLNKNASLHTNVLSFFFYFSPSAIFFFNFFEKYNIYKFNFTSTREKLFLRYYIKACKKRSKSTIIYRASYIQKTRDNNYLPSVLWCLVNNIMVSFENPDLLRVVILVARPTHWLV